MGSRSGGAGLKGLSAGTDAWHGAACTAAGREGPHVIEAPGIDDQLVEWARRRVDVLKSLACRYGGVLLRGFTISEQDYELFAELFSTEMLLPCSEARYDARKKIPWHNDGDVWRNRWPEHVIFFCARAARRGGATILADGRRVVQALPEAVVELLAAKGIMYCCRYTDASGTDWMRDLGVTEATELRNFCELHKIAIKRQGRELELRRSQPAVVRHPALNAPVWFGQLFVYHEGARSGHGDSAGEEGGVSRARERSKTVCLLGDGSEMKREVLREIVRAHEFAEVPVRWRSGDVIVVNNTVCAHSREPYVGDRRLLVAMRGNLSYPAPHGRVASSR